MGTELNLFVLIIEVIWLTTVLYAVGHYLTSQEETYFIVEGYYKKGVFQKILICLIASVVIVIYLYIMSYLCIWLLAMNGIKASSMHEALLIVSLRC